MENKVSLGQIKFFHLENSMGMYSICNSDTLEKLINTLHKMNNKMTWNERLFAGNLNHWYHWYLSKDGVGHYTINSLLYLTSIHLFTITGKLTPEYIKLKRNMV